MRFILRVLAALLLLLTSQSISFAQNSYPGWPKILKDFPESPSDSLVHRSIKIKGFTITFEDGSWKEQEEGGGTGGHVVEVSVKNSTGRTLTFSTQWVGARILENLNGWPQLEIWGRASGGTWCRELHYFANGRYRIHRVDDFFDYSARAKNVSIKTTLPSHSQVLYYGGTSDVEDPDPIVSK
jgi:hypothetical protein